MHFTSAVSLAALALASTAAAEVWTLTDTFIGQDFLSGFTHETIADPTHGRVYVPSDLQLKAVLIVSRSPSNYVDQPTALAANLTFATADTLIMRADATTVLDPNGPGRNSIRIKSNKTYTQHTVVFDVRHMPEGCATWPSAWEVDEATWPATGEIDIIEGANNISVCHFSCSQRSSELTGCKAEHRDPSHEPWLHPANQPNHAGVCGVAFELSILNSLYLGQPTSPTATRSSTRAKAAVFLSTARRRMGRSSTLYVR
jgi:hypothetical protein